MRGGRDTRTRGRTRRVRSHDLSLPSNRPQTLSTRPSPFFAPTLLTPTLIPSSPSFCFSSCTPPPPSPFAPISPFLTSFVFAPDPSPNPYLVAVTSLNSFESTFVLPPIRATRVRLRREREKVVRSLARCRVLASSQMRGSKHGRESDRSLGALEETGAPKERGTASLHMGFGCAEGGDYRSSLGSRGSTGRSSWGGKRKGVRKRRESFRAS